MAISVIKSFEIRVSMALFNSCRRVLMPIELRQIRPDPARPAVLQSEEWSITGFAVKKAEKEQYTCCSETTSIQQPTPSPPPPPPLSLPTAPPLPQFTPPSPVPSP